MREIIYFIKIVFREKWAAFRREREEGLRFFGKFSEINAKSRGWMLREWILLIFICAQSRKI